MLVHVLHPTPHSSHLYYKNGKVSALLWKYGPLKHSPEIAMGRKRENHMQVKGGFISMFRRTGAKRVRMRGDKHSYCMQGLSPLCIFQYNTSRQYHGTVCMCTSQTPTRKISLKYKMTRLCVNLLERVPKNFLQRCQSATPSSALMTTDRGSNSVSFDDGAV